MNVRYQTAVILHLYYLELWDEIDSYLDNLNGQFDLYVSVPFEADPAVLTNIRESYPSSRIIRYGNTGRDIAPFLEIFSAIAPLYKYICKIHSKKTLQLSGGDEWRQDLYEELLGSAEKVREIMAAFENNSKIGMIGPANHVESIRSSKWTGFREYRDILTMWAEKIGVERIDQLMYYYFGGTMFWFRSKALMPILDMNIKQADFGNETGAYDGTMAHALERFFPVAAFAAGFAIYDTDHLAPGCASDINPVYDEPVKAKKRIWSAPANRLPGVNLVGPVEFINGVGVSSRGYAKSLEHAGIALNVVPWRKGFERLNRVDVKFPESGLQPINLIHLNLDLLAAERLLDRGILAELTNADRYNICVPYWELSELPPVWHETLDRFDEVWCASSFMADAVSKAFSGTVRVIRPALEWQTASRDYSRKEFLLPEGKFIFFYTADIGSIMGRKNPMALLRAYVEEFQQEEGACCLIKINYANRSSTEVRELINLSKQRPDVIFMDKLLEEHRMRALFDQIDCYVSPHRSEGLGLTILEAMHASKPVIATPYGGVTDFVMPETAFPLDFRIVPVGEGNFPYPPDYVWAEPSIASLRKSMRQVFLDRKNAQETASRGREFVDALFSLEKTSSIMHDEIRRVWYGK